ncbi:hypothetical protein IEQ34_002986 [Dendrobium chrysotoxum]|uniref:Uncharacterized protein n=1 Tax=Dendrobium chrysotoxum TaxID=161865 RepID=A0AAV7HIR2_DENCH|nr:hypothetical protein IEQ34_002986 [Dendrobium chrysotoxum]
MKENHVSELVAQECIWNIIKKYWKELNREWINGSRYEETFRTFAINVPRAGHLMYLQSNDGNIGELNVEEMKENIFSLLLEPITLKQDLLVKSYRDEKGCFKPCVFHDIKGPLSLYEASFLSMDGEDEIDEAKEFAVKHLNDCMRSNSSTNPVLAKHISLALELPLHHRIQKLQAPMFIEHARNLKELDVDPILLEFAQLDFNMTQSIYNRELKEITRWWTEVSNVFDSKLNFARDWPVESYFLAVGMAVEPQFSTCRKELAKALCFIFVIDDIYDIYGLLDELQLFTNAVDRWEFASIKSLPEYMKICLEGLFNMVNKLAGKIKEEKGLDVLPNLKRAWLDLCKAYMVEARWYHTGYCPTFEEYLDNAWISVSTPLLSVIAHCLSENLTNLSLESFDFYPSIVRQSSIIFRLYNDLGTSKGELQRGDVSKSIQCYMKENHVSELVAQECIRNIIRKYWKELNREWIKGSRYEETFKMVAINMPRAAHVMYLQSNDVEEMKDNVSSLLLEPITFKQAVLCNMWWTEESNVFDSKLNFARDWPVESYFLAVGMAVEPQFSTCRKELAKALCFIFVIDDIYDIYGLLDELQLFINAVDRWEFASIKSLPEYMKICLEGLFNMVNKIASKIKEEKGLDVLPNLKRAVKLLQLLNKLDIFS